MTIALVLVIAVIAFGRGGYEPWATFALELAAAGLVVVAIARAGAGAEPEPLRRARYRAWMGLPFPVRHPFLSRCLRLVSLGAWPRGSSTSNIEILLPVQGGGERIEIDVGRETFVLGHAFKRTGLGAPLVFLSLWIAMSIVPVSRSILAFFSPTGARLRAEAESLVGLTAPASAPFSLVPFLSARSFWLWVAHPGSLLRQRVSRAPLRRGEAARPGVSRARGGVGYLRPRRLVRRGPGRLRNRLRGAPRAGQLRQPEPLRRFSGHAAPHRDSGGLPAFAPAAARIARVEVRAGRVRTGTRSPPSSALACCFLRSVSCMSLSRSGLTACLGGAAVFVLLD